MPESIDSAIELQAQYAVSMYLCGDPMALTANVTQTETIQVKVGDITLPLTLGPVAALTSLKRNGVVLTEGFKVGWWSITSRATATEAAGFRPGEVIEVSFKQGWNVLELPKILQQAVNLEAEALAADPDNIKSESVGKYSVTYSDKASGVLLSGKAQLLLQNLRSWQVLQVY